MSKTQVVSELWEFMKQNKKYWLAPIVITLVLFGVLLVLAKGSAIAPFIYTLFQRPHLLCQKFSASRLSITTLLHAS